MARGTGLQRLPASVTRGVSLTSATWRLSGHAPWFPPGRLIEVSGTGAVARTTLAVAAVLEAQRQGETAAWIQPACGPLFPPDLSDSGVDLDALVVVLVPPSDGFYGAPKAAELLLRSGSFGLVIVDLSLRAPRGDMAWQGRLLGMAREHSAKVVLLTQSPARADSLSSLVSLRMEPRRVRVGRGSFVVERAVLKDKTGNRDLDTSIRTATSMPRRGPWGLS